MASTEIRCAHCGRLTPVEETLFWTERERRRVFSGIDGSEGPFSYVHEDTAKRICLRCYAELASGARMGEIANRRGLAILIAAIVLAVIVALLTPVIMPTLLSAFWQS